MPVIGNSHIAQENNILSIQADLNGFSFSIHDQAGYCVALQHYDYTIIDYNDLDNKIHDIFRRDGRLRQAYRKCSCLFLSEKSTLIPATLFNEQHLRTYLDFVAPLDELDEIHFRPVNPPDAMAVFAIPSPIAAAVNTYQPNAVFYHQCIPLIRRLHEQQPYNGVSLHLSRDLVSVALYAGSRLVLYNTFKVYAFTDALYYVSFLLKQWQLSPGLTTLHLSGYLLNEHEGLLHNYFPSIKIIRAAAISNAFGEKSGMEYQLLHALNTCES